MKSIPSISAGKDDDLIPLRNLGKPDALNCSRSLLYSLKQSDRDFRRLIPILYLNSVPYVMRGDVAAYKAYKRRQALLAAEPKVGRPRGRSRKNLPAAEGDPSST